MAEVSKIVKPKEVLIFRVELAAEQVAAGSVLIMVCCKMNSESESEV